MCKTEAVHKRPQFKQRSALAARTHPLEALVEPVSGGGAGGLNVPLPLPEAVQAELVGNLGGVHGVGQILLVGKDQEEGVPQLVLVQHPLQLLARLNDTVAIVRVNNKDDALGVLEVCARTTERATGL